MARLAINRSNEKEGETEGEEEKIIGIEEETLTVEDREWLERDKVKEEKRE